MMILCPSCISPPGAFACVATIGRSARPVDVRQLRKREMTLGADEKRLEKLLEKIKADQDGIKKQTAAIKDREVKFDERVKAFEAAAKRVGENA